MRHAHHSLHAGHHGGAVVPEAIERTGGDQAFENAFADDLRVDSLAEVGKARELCVAALFDNVLDRRVSHTLDGRQRIEDAIFANLEVAEARLHRRRHNIDAQAQGVLAEVAELVGIRHVERHRSCKEFDRVMRLQIGGLVGDDRVGRGVALVEAVVGEFGQEVEDEIGLRLSEAALDGA